MKKYLLVLAAAALITSCSKNNDNVEPGYNEANLATLSVEFDNIVGERTLVLNNTANPYTNAAGEKFTISKLQYFISNIKVSKADGTTYTVKQDSSYFLIKGDDKETRFATVKVPEGDYTKLIFIVGVDSLRSTMGVSDRTGVLDPSGSMEDGMYWSWNSGYIFFKMEGNSDVISNDASGDPTGKKQFKFHIGGFGGYSAPTINNIKTVSVDLSAGGIARVRKDRESNIHLLVDLMQVFNGTNSFKIAEHPNVMFSDFSTKVAGNFAGMFRHDHTEN